ncbi:hypothetical protein HYFRA_00006005 [Hymenoscyphus fraxineus]|uniref:BHLH domain-containing protein n=1 Tax=Hymenoscyphus fraxineus TaxID=746836 RepID=A0A9N9PIF9_9HELO|nr:hypothetical protein HYFRA_00006005 [Hymenoscyphus fraxineus]
MDPMVTNNYFTSPLTKSPEIQDWANNWMTPRQPWESKMGGDMPIWQYTQAALSQRELPQSYFPLESPLSSHYPQSACSSAIQSPHMPEFPAESAFPHTPTTFEPPRPNLKRSRRSESADQEEEMNLEDEDSDYAWDTISGPPPSKSAVRMIHRRTQSATEQASIKLAKKAHTVVEKNYRERLNDKIADLAVYLFETSSDARAKPSKSLVMTRAKERLKQLEAKNRALESEVAKLRQQIAIHDHVAAAEKQRCLDEIKTEARL